MRYKIEFELPDNKTIQKEIKKTLVQWNFHGYSGTCFAEPEQEEFEWCHDCKEYDQEKHCCHRWTKVIRQTVKEVKAQYALEYPEIVHCEDCKFYTMHQK